MKTKKELEKIKEEFSALNKKLSELSEEELSQVSGGVIAGINLKIFPLPIDDLVKETGPVRYVEEIKIVE